MIETSRQLVFKNNAPGDTSDGYHTFNELYDHRRALTAALFATANDLGINVWRSRRHHPDDSPMFDGGWFVVGMELSTGTVTYHYELKHWDDFQNIPEREHAPKWDGAPPAATVSRLIGWARM